MHNNQEQRSMLFLRQLKIFGIGKDIMIRFSRAIIESVLTFFYSCMVPVAKRNVDGNPLWNMHPKSLGASCHPSSLFTWFAAPENPRVFCSIFLDFFPLAYGLGVLKPEQLGLKTVYTHRPWDTWTVSCIILCRRVIYYLLIHYVFIYLRIYLHVYTTYMT